MDNKDDDLGFSELAAKQQKLQQMQQQVKQQRLDLKKAESNLEQYQQNLETAKKTLIENETHLKSWISELTKDMQSYEKKLVEASGSIEAELANPGSSVH